MDKKIVGAVGAITGLAALGGAAQAAVTPPVADTGNMNARSFAELLDPIPNALATLRATDAAARDEQALSQGDEVQVAGYRHHHHHHRYYRHHHHHHHRAIVIRPGRVIIRGHHHHHHHHNY